jgi:predicted site-specific integrase-resolvase
MNYAAAKQYYEREGHLRVPRKRVERIAVGEDQEERELQRSTAPHSRVAAASMYFLVASVMKSRLLPGLRA